VIVKIPKIIITIIKGEFTRREVVVGKVPTYLCLTLIVKEKKMNVD